MENEQIQTYLIPNNFIDESRTFNGMLKTRHVIEAAVCLVVLGGASWLFIPPTVSFKLTLALGISLPLPLACLAGINGDSLFTFVKYATKWKKTKQVMLYNSEARTFQSRPIEVAMTELTPADRVMGVYEQWREGQSAKLEQVELVENVDFVFMEDTEYEKMTIVPDDKKERLKEEKRREKIAREQAKEQAKYEARQKKELAKEEKKNKRKKKSPKVVEEQTLTEKELPVLDIASAEGKPQSEDFSFEDVSVETIIQQQEQSASSEIKKEDILSSSNEEPEIDSKDENLSGESNYEDCNPVIEQSSEKDVADNNKPLDDGDANTKEDNKDEESVVFGGMNENVTDAQPPKTGSNDSSEELKHSEDKTSNQPVSATNNATIPHKRKRSRSRKKKNNGGGNPQ